MWSNLPSHLLSTIFSYLPPHSFAFAKSTCHSWLLAASLTTPLPLPHHPPWFLIFPSPSSIIAHNPITLTWHHLPLPPSRAISSTLSGLLLLKLLSTPTSLNLALFNPFTTHSKLLPNLNSPRTNPAIGLISTTTNHIFKIYVAGGATIGGASYNSTIESYDSLNDKWTVLGSMPVEFAVRLTVWTPNESVYAEDEKTLYWMTSARAYSVMGYKFERNEWIELKVPMADKLEFAALVPRRGKLGLVGGWMGKWCHVWEMVEREWRVVGKMPLELGRRLRLGMGGDCEWGSSSVRCVGVEGVVCLYRDVSDGFVIWRGLEEWKWVKGYEQMVKNGYNVGIKGLLLYPNLGHFLN